MKSKLLRPESELRRQPDYGEEGSYTSEINEANSKVASDQKWYAVYPIVDHCTDNDNVRYIKASREELVQKIPVKTVRSEELAWAGPEDELGGYESCNGKPFGIVFNATDKAIWYCQELSEDQILDLDESVLTKTSSQVKEKFKIEFLSHLAEFGSFGFIWASEDSEGILEALRDTYGDVVDTEEWNVLFSEEDEIPQDIMVYSEETGDDIALLTKVPLEDMPDSDVLHRHNTKSSARKGGYPIRITTPDGQSTVVDAGLGSSAAIIEATRKAIGLSRKIVDHQMWHCCNTKDIPHYESFSAQALEKMPRHDKIVYYPGNYTAITIAYIDEATLMDLDDDAILKRVK